MMRHFLDIKMKETLTADDDKIPTDQQKMPTSKKLCWW